MPEPHAACRHGHRRTPPTTLRTADGYGCLTGSFARGRVRDVLRAWARLGPTRPGFFAVVLSTLVLAGFVLPACSAVGLSRGPRSNSTITGQDGRVALAPGFQTFAYVPGPNSTADVYLTDFTSEQLDAFFDPSGAWTGLDGHILHVHMFLTPRAGSTPIDPTAANAAARLLVLSGGQIGVYTGAGFLLPDRRPGGRTFSGDILDASLRLDHASDYFIDRLGPTRLRLSFTAPRNEELAASLAARLNAAQRTAGPVADVEPKSERGPLTSEAGE